MRLKEIREKFELTQQDLTEYLGMDQKTYHNIENELTKRIKLEVLIKLAFLYNTSIDYLVGLSNTKQEFPKDKEQEIIKKYKINLYLVIKLREKATFQKEKTPAP